MKKLINDPANVVDELIDGFVYTNKDKVKRIGRHTVVARIDAPIKDKVGIVIGGGAGHEPLFLEYIGKVWQMQKHTDRFLQRLLLLMDWRQ